MRVLGVYASLNQSFPKHLQNINFDANCLFHTIYVMNWFNRIVAGLSSDIAQSGQHQIPKGLWEKCSRCDKALYIPDLEKKLSICPHCQHHHRISAKRRIDIFLDGEGRVAICENIKPYDWLKFKDSKRYVDRIADAQKKTGNQEAALAYSGTLMKQPVVIMAFDFAFLGGSMSSGIGEIFRQCCDLAIVNKHPFICFSSSGGARMQEGLMSLMQMGKTSAAIAKLKQHNIPFISVLTDPTYGGVTASLAMLGDVIIAEADAAVGFAGPRVIQQTVRETLPEGFQTSKFLLEHGAVDMIVTRTMMRSTIAHLLQMLTANVNSK